MSKKKKHNNDEGSDEPESEVSEGSASGIDANETEVVPKKDWLINCPPTFVKGSDKVY